jgi:hypothetical protein
LQKEQCSLVCLLVLREIPLYAFFLFSTKGWISQYNINSVFLPDFTQGKPQGIKRVNVWVFQSMKKQVHLAEQIWQGFSLNAEKRLALEPTLVSGSLALLFQMIKGRC